MTIHQAILYGERSLREAGVDQPRWNAEQLLLLALQQPRSKVYTELSRPLTDSETEAYHRFLTRRSEHYPLAYLEGKQEFFGRDFVVNETVLIPRPETEEVIHAVLGLDLPSFPRILDLGAGSGNIAVTLAIQLPHATVFALERSPAAFDTLRANSGERIILIRGDFYHSPFADQKFDAITSNPPYVESMQELPAETRWEPALALMAGDLEEVYSALLKQALRLLKPMGYLVFEIGFGQESRIAALCETFAFTLVEVRNDHRSIPRTFVLRKHPKSRR